jgi:hypothetical protein
MEENINQHRSRVEVPLNEPHFDEEATLLSARPVVPLEEVKGEARSRRRLVFVLSILIAVAAGAVGGTLLYKYRSQISSTEVQTAIPTAEQASGQTAAVADAGGDTLDSHSNALSATDEKAPETVVPEAADRSGSSPAKSPTRAATRADGHAAAQNPDAENRRDDRIARENDDDSEQELRRQERKEIRRRAREAQREARRSRETSDDLLRIREIFEGAPKP